MDDNIMQFTNRTEFRAWLEENCQTASGIWLLFGKAGGPETLTAGEALEEALCLDRKSTRLNSSHTDISRMPSSA